MLVFSKRDIYISKFIKVCLFFSNEKHISEKYLLNCATHLYLKTHIAASDTSRLLSAGTKNDDQTQDTRGSTGCVFIQNNESSFRYWTT